MTARRVLSAIAAATVLACVAPAGASAQSSDPCATPVTNPIACENTKAGTPESVWGIDGTEGDPTLQGFATSMSVNHGEAISFKIKSEASYTLDIYRARLLRRRRRTPGRDRHQPHDDQPGAACTTQSDHRPDRLRQLGHLGDLHRAEHAVSGRLHRPAHAHDNSGDSQIPFVVRDDSSTSDVVVQTSDATWQAYNNYGGNSLYICTVACPPGDPDGYKAAYAVSYNRPFDDRRRASRSWCSLGAEYPMIRFLEANGYDVSYIARLDVGHARQPAAQPQGVHLQRPRRVLVAATSAPTSRRRATPGVNLAFFSGNEVFWKTRWSRAPSARRGQPHAGHLQGHALPGRGQDPVEWTGTWRDPRFAAPPESGRRRTRSPARRSS